jgi:alanine racemase
MEFDDSCAVQSIEVDGNAPNHSPELPRKTVGAGASLLAVVKANMCMNTLMVDASGMSDVSIGEEVVFFARQGGDQIQVEELASLSHTINSESLVRLSPTIPLTVV